MPQSLSPILPVKLPRRTIDPDAYMVCRRLQEAGFETFLVGGCVRDIILGREPKDFDVGTFATPNQVRRIFRNCRLIGRRFRLAHIVFGQKIIEVATFRGGEGDPEDEAGDGDTDDKLIRRANNFGTAEEDARRRDFTVNALFYDPVAERVLDHVNGYADLRLSVVKTIGHPEDRFQEDPVRILRAIKFASRLNFTIDADTLAAIPVVAPDILRCPMPRVTEEIYRLAESGHARAAFALMADNGVLEVILPEVFAWMQADRVEYEAHLDRLDGLKRAHGTLPREFVMSMIYLPLAMAQVAAADVAPGPAWGAVVEEWFRDIGVRMHVAVKHRMRLRGIVVMLGRFHVGPRKRKGLGSHERRVLPQALTVARLEYRRTGELAEGYRWWRQLAKENDVTWVPVSEPSGMEREEDAPRSGGRRRRRGGRNRGSRSGASS